LYKKAWKLFKQFIRETNIVQGGERFFIEVLDTLSRRSSMCELLQLTVIVKKYQQIQSSNPESIIISHANP
jgi:hypothetical protein